jgi:nicotinic acid mononucleotide adenylyltransferase
LPAAFNPPTTAHWALLEAARAHVDHVACVLPTVYPHKGFEGAQFSQRLELLEALHPALGILITQGGLFQEIAREFRAEIDAQAEVWFLCGRDAAERIATWDYGPGATFASQLQEYGLLVAARGGEFAPQPQWAGRVQALALPGDFEAHSSTRVREAIASGSAWEHLVPASLIEPIRRVYGSR